MEEAKEIILHAMKQVPGVLPEPLPDVIAVGLDTSTVNLRARWWTDSRRLQTLEIQDRVIIAIKNELTARGIDIPFQTQVILFHDQTEETDGDRSRQREGWPAGNRPVPRPRYLPQALTPTQKGSAVQQASERGEQ